MTQRAELVDMAAEIVSAYVAGHQLSPGELPGLIQAVFGALSGLTVAQGAEPPAVLEPAVPIKKSITDDFLICLEDGKKFKSLKRHLRTRYGMSPEEYRARWGLPQNYPMVAPNYAKARSDLAKRMGLGTGRRGG